MSDDRGEPGSRLQIEPGDLVALAFDEDAGVAVAARSATIDLPGDPVAIVQEIERELRPRWVWWDRSTADRLAAADVVVDKCWDLLIAHRLQAGGWATSVAEVWAHLHGLDVATVPQMGQLDLLTTADEGDDLDQPTRPDGHLRPEWIAGSWAQSARRRERWAELTLESATTQIAQLDATDPSGRLRSTARSESAAELLCAELERDGLPIDETEAIRIIGDASGPRPRTYAEEDAARAQRDAEVLRLLEPRQDVNLRNPAEVKGMLRRAGLDLPDTRAWRLEQLRGTDPLIDALMRWRKDERIATTYGWTWLDENVTGGRLRGTWTSADGAAGRMTASAGLHNLPAPMRPAVAAEDGYRFVRADLGQIEPRVLAAVSGDSALIEATREADLYRPVAHRLGVSRDIAKVAVLGAMYGATTGESAGALQGLQRSFPTAMQLLENAAERGRIGEDVFTIGGRRVRMGGGASPDGDIERARSAAASRGRYARNALIQGAAAEFFKVWAVLVRRRLRPLGASVVLCLHDELLVHVPEQSTEAAADAMTAAIGEAAHHWSPQPDVRFVADVSIIHRWSEAKD